MDIKVKVGNIRRSRANAIVLGIFEGIKRPRGDGSTINKALGGSVSQLIHEGEIKGKLGEVTIIHSLGKITPERVVLLGLGKRSELSLEKIRIPTAELCRALQKKGVKHLAMSLIGAGFNKINPQTAAWAISEGAILGLYSFRKHFSKDSEQGQIEEITIVERSRSIISAIKQGLERG